MWQELLLAAIGEQFSECMAPGDCVCGVSVRIKGYDQDAVQIWNEDSELHYKATVRWCACVGGLLMWVVCLCG